jgi:PAS domain S-box-containing protein
MPGPSTIDHLHAELAALRASEARYRSVFETMGQGYCELELVRDSAGRAVDQLYLKFNPAFERLFGIPRAEAEGRTASEMFPTLESWWTEAFGRIVEQRRPERLEHVFAALERTFELHVHPVGGDRLVVLFDDVTELRRAGAAVRESEARMRDFGEASQDVLWVREAETLQWLYLTPAFATIYGLSRTEALSGDNYRSWLELIVPEDRAGANAAIDRVRAGEHLTFEYRIRRPRDGEIRWLRDTDFPIADTEGRITRIGGIGKDITDAKLAHDRTERSEERLRSAVEVGRLGLWDWNVHTGEVHWSDEHFRMEGYGVGEVRPSYEAWTARIHPDDRPRAEGALRQAMAAREEYVQEFRVVHPNGSVHWLYGRGRFFYDHHGAPVRMIGAMVETTERRELEERQRVLVAELQHRTRNLMGVVRSMADKTARASADLVDFRARFRDRLDALSRVQGLLSRLNDLDRVTFDELIRTELSAMAGGSDRVSLSGPSGVRLRSSTVQTLAMALHELSTNAVKYGALGAAGGRLAVRWTCERDSEAGKPWLHIDWRERGVAMPPAGALPTGAGEGRELIERALPYQLRARTTYRFMADGVHCTISIPVSESTGAEAVDA